MKTELISILAHLSYLFLFFGFLFGDPQLSRFFIVLGSALGVFYCFSAEAAPILIPATWLSLFFLFNLLAFGRVSLRKRAEELDPLELLLKKGPFSLFESKEIKSIARIGVEGALQTGEKLLEFGKTNNEIYCVLKGNLAVHNAQGNISHAGPGSLIGVKIFFGETESESEVVAKTDAVVLAWSFASIQDWVSSDPRKMSLLQSLIGWQVIETIMAEQKSA